MSKKMMKRSLAFGALMAFVITGNALAAGESNKEMTVSDSRTAGFRNSSTVLAEEAVLSENNVLNITTGLILILLLEHHQLLILLLVLKHLLLLKIIV